MYTLGYEFYTSILQSARADVSEERVVTTSHVTTPELLLPEYPRIFSTSDQNKHSYPHERRRSGGDDSVDKCDGLLAARDDSEVGGLVHLEA